MRFGRTLRQSTYQPWRSHYIDYAKLKTMLREYEADEDVPWTEEDENQFCDEIFNVQLEKVAGFQHAIFKNLQDRVDAAFETLKTLAPQNNGAKGDITSERLKEIEQELDNITNEVKELRKYSNLNYTGFLKIVKKHDRRRGDRYRIRPMMQLRLSRRPFNSEHGYSPLLNKLSVMYFIIRQHFEDANGSEQAAIVDADVEQETRRNGERYTAHKFWVHPDNLLEVKTYILRRLPSLVFSQLSSAKDLDVKDDPTITSLYLDNSKFQMYANKVEREMKATSVRLRWYGQLSSKPEIFFEKKTVGEQGVSEETRFPIKSKYVKPFMDGEYKMEKTIQKMERQGQPEAEIAAFRSTVNSIAEFIHENQLQPVLRANYVRTAFQKPSDDRVRISLDTDIVFIREDTLDADRPCRDPGEWHRTDIDDSNMTYPFKNINQSEVSRFPFAVMEIKLKEDGAGKRPSWVEDLMGSHLVYSATKFSKFVHGTASLFEDYVNSLPFWLSDLETDIRKDPQAAFEEEEQRRAQQAEDEQVVGSFLGSKVNSMKLPRGSPFSKSHLSERPTFDGAKPSTPQGTVAQQPVAGEESQQSQSRFGYGTMSLLTGLSASRYAKARRSRAQSLPEGVEEPAAWIKNSGPLQIEPKVWLANERTFLKWQHISVLLGGLAVALYTAGGKDSMVQLMGVVYIGIAAFAAFWGYMMHRIRRGMIIERSGKDFDNLVGPMVVSLALIAALVLNFVFQYRAAFSTLPSGPEKNSTDLGMAGEMEL